MPSLLLITQRILYKRLNFSAQFLDCQMFLEAFFTFIRRKIPIQSQKIFPLYETQQLMKARLIRHTAIGTQFQGQDVTRNIHKLIRECFGKFWSVKQNIFPTNKIRRRTHLRFNRPRNQQFRQANIPNSVFSIFGNVQIQNPDVSVQGIHKPKKPHKKTIAQGVKPDDQPLTPELNNQKLQDIWIFLELIFSQGRNFNRLLNVQRALQRYLE